MAAGIRGGMGIASLVLIAGAIVLMFFVVLSGVTDRTPLNNTWFLQADTSTIAGSGRATSQWTYFYVCGAGNTNCGSPVPALPIGYAWVGGSAGAPANMVGAHGKGTTSKYYYYMWRFGWVFYLMGLFFTVVAFFSSLLAPCSRLASGLAGSVLAFALFWFTIGVSLMTAVFVSARNSFRSAGLSARIGRYAFGFSWGAWAAIFLATIFLFCGCGLGGSSSRSERRRSANVHDDKVRNIGSNGTPAAGGGGSNLAFWRRQRHNRSARGSFVDNESQRRVKEEYA